MKTWGWRPDRTNGIWRTGAGWLRPLAVAAPWLTVILLLVMFHVVSGTLTVAKGVLFDLPDSARASDGEIADLALLVLPVAHDTLVFFDDSRYVLGATASMRTFQENLTARLAQTKRKTLLVLADRRIPAGELMELATAARTCGAQRILFAEKERESGE